MATYVLVGRGESRVVLKLKKAPHVGDKITVEKSQIVWGYGYYMVGNTYIVTEVKKAAASWDNHVLSSIGIKKASL